MSGRRGGGSTGPKDRFAKSRNRHKGAPGRNNQEFFYPPVDDPDYKPPASTFLAPATVVKTTPCARLVKFQKYHYWIPKTQTVSVDTKHKIIEVKPWFLKKLTPITIS